jgi:hypothetical protein
MEYSSAKGKGGAQYPDASAAEKPQVEQGRFDWAA